MSTFVDSYSVPLLLPSPILCRPFPIFFSLPVPSIDWIQPPAASPAASRQHAAPPRYPPLRLLMFFQGGSPSCLILSDGAWLLGRKHRGDVLLPTALVARVALVAAYAWARGEQATDQDRRRKEKKTRLEFFLKPLEICEIKGRS